MLDSTIDRLFQNMRTRKLLSKLGSGGIILDIGCNENILFFNEAKRHFDIYVGLDIRIKNNNSMNFVKYFVKDSLPFKSESFDTISMIAVFEHLEFKEAAMKEVFRVLKKRGRLLMTIPSPKAEHLIRLFAIFGIISKELADEHINLMDKFQINKLLDKIGFQNIEVSKFEFGLNYLISAFK